MTEQVFERFDLPDGWTWTELEHLVSSITDGPFGSNLKSSDYVDGGARVIRLGNIGIGNFVDDDRSFVSLEKFAALKKHAAVAGDLVIAALAEPVGRACVVPDDLGLALVKADCIRARVDKRISSRLLLHWLNSPDGLRSAALASHGIGRLRINLGEVRALPVPLPPINEQRRIVAKLDAVFEKSRAARARLERLPALLEKLKRSILAAAFRGELTKDWREAHPDVEPASVLLERVASEQRQRWEDEVRAKGRDPKKISFEAPQLPASTRPLVLPETWATTALGAVSDVDWGNTSLTKDSYRESGVTAFSASGPDGFVETAEHDTHGIVLSAIGARCGRCFRAAGRWTAIKNTITILPFIADPEFSDYLFRYLDDSEVWDKKGGAQPFITLGVARPLTVPLPPIEEMNELVRRLEAAFAALAALRTRAEQMVASTMSLERAALAKAFRGELVPQDPNDEPAAVLLERLRAERAAAPAPRRTRGKTSPPAPLSTAARGLAVERGRLPNTQPGASADGDDDALVAAFRKAAVRSAADLAADTGLDAAVVKKGLKALVEAGRVKVEGKARGTRYVWNG